MGNEPLLPSVLWRSAFSKSRCLAIAQNLSKRLGKTGVETLLFPYNGKAAEERYWWYIPSARETYPTDSKLAIKIINRLNKLAKAEGVQQTFVKEVKAFSLSPLPSCQASRQGQTRTQALTHHCRHLAARATKKATCPCVGASR